MPTELEQQDIHQRLAALRLAHGDLDVAIRALADQGTGDQLQIARMKRRKLRLKDEINMLEGQLIPDIIA